jgi:sugar lactone lactonase YvrE
VEVPAGCTSPACQITVVSGVTSYGVAVDPTGVVSYVDFNSGALVEVLQQFYGLGFSPSLVGNISGDSPKSVTLQNVGNQTLSATGPGLAFPDPDFYQTPRSGTPADCTSAFSLVSGATCNVSIDFDPLSAGMLNGSATFTDNGLNNSPYSQSFSLSGIGIPGSGSNILTVTGSGAGRGSVASGDTLISCSLSGGNATGVCAAAYSSGTVTLTAAPAANSAFAGWSGACASYGTTAQCTVAMNQSQNVTAKFVQGYLGTVSVCADGNPSGCTGTSQTVTFNFIASTTVSSVQVVTQGQPGLDFQYGGSDTCSGNTFSSGQSCTVTVAFTPTAPGLRLGAVELLNNGSVVATRLVYGIGQGPAISFNPATQVSVNVQGNFTLGANYVAVDAAGDVFISDDRNGQIVEVAAASGTTTTIAGVATPQGLALDGAGDLFVAEAGTPGEVVEFTPPCTNISCQNVVYNPGGSSSPGDVAIDGAGDLFIADVGLHEVVEIPAGGATQTVVYPSSPNSNSVPGGVAVDAAGDLFVADSGLKTVVELPANGGAQIPFGGLWISPTSVAVDAAGDVYVTDTGLTEAVEVPPSCSGPNAAFSCMVSLSNLADFPATSLALDSLGDVFVAEPSQDQVLELQASLSATVSFGEVGEGYRSNYGSPQFDTPLFIQNIGNGSQPLTGSVGPISGAYYFEDSSGTTCTSFTLASAATCVENLYFYPQNAVGLLNASAAVTDNTLSASPATQNINLAGFSYGLPVTVSVTGTGSGSVSSDPQLVNCAIVAGVPTGGGCSASVNTGFTYSFFESAISGYVFTGWGGACSSYGSNQICNVEIIGPTSIIANFAPAASYTLTVADVGTGSGSVSSNSSASPAINNCAISNGLVTGTCSENDPSGAQVILTASANGTSTFVGWGGACAGSGASATCNVTINSALSVSASFAAPGSSQSGVLKPITAGVVYGQGGSFTSNTANNGGISASSINSLADLVFDSSGNLYVSDALNARVLFYPAGSTTATRVYGQNGSFTTNTANSGGVSANSL